MKTSKIFRPLNSCLHFQIASILKPTFLLILLGIVPILACAQGQPTELGDSSKMNLLPALSNGICNEYVSVNASTGMLESKTVVLIKRGTYEYLIKLEKKAQGTVATIQSVGGEKFSVDDEFIFINANNERVSFRVVSVNQGNDIASFMLSVEKTKWLASVGTTTFYIKNNQKHQVYKFTIATEVAATFQTLMDCYLNRLSN